VRFPRSKFLVILVGVLGAMALFLMAAIKSRPQGGLVYFHTVDEFHAMPHDAGGSFRVNGKVRQGSIERLPSGQDVRFVMTGSASSLPVAYHGIIPDTFVDGADVTVEGSLTSAGTFAATNLMAKCPSKYEAAASERASTAKP
jgi:cytochrome c-type biogenesis protein CcmE